MTFDSAGVRLWEQRFRCVCVRARETELIGTVAYEKHVIIVIIIIVNFLSLLGNYYDYHCQMKTEPDDFLSVVLSLDLSLPHPLFRVTHSLSRKRALSALRSRSMPDVLNMIEYQLKKNDVFRSVKVNIIFLAVCRTCST
jgi:hypothetical protein